MMGVALASQRQRERRAEVEDQQLMKEFGR
jgi:hypothetical protein